MTTVVTEIIRRIYDTDVGAYVQIGPDPDTPEMLCMGVADPESVEWFGAFTISGDKEFMQHLGEALIAATKEMKP
jgi:hypothetical protein